MVDRRAREPPRDLVELGDRGPHLGERRDRLLVRRRSGLDRRYGSAAPARQLGLDELSEGWALCTERFTASLYGVKQRQSLGWYVTYNKRTGDVLGYTHANQRGSGGGYGGL